jgi:hypothetical protein
LYTPYCALSGLKNAPFFRIRPEVSNGAEHVASSVSDMSIKADELKAIIQNLSVLVEGNKSR